MLGTNNVVRAKIAAIVVRIVRTLWAELARKTPWRGWDCRWAL